MCKSYEGLGSSVRNNALTDFNSTFEDKTFKVCS